MKLRYGTRGSALALAQSDQIAAQLKKINPGIELERLVIRTSGDSAESAPVATNVKALFVKEIEESLLGGDIDFAVHSAKDLPADLPEGLLIAAYPEREDPRDVYITGSKSRRWGDLRPGDVIGTSSLRRRFQVEMAKPGIKAAVLRGNVDTRLKNLESGVVSGIVLALAGLKRLGRAATCDILPVDVMVPAPGQGALAVESRSDRKDVLKVLAALDDAQTRMDVECERALMKAVGGGCRTPFGAYARREGSEICLDIFWSDETGRRPVRRQARCEARPDAVACLVKSVAKDLLLNK